MSWQHRLARRSQARGRATFAKQCEERRAKQRLMPHRPRRDQRVPRKDEAQDVVRCPHCGSIIRPWQLGTDGEGHVVAYCSQC